MRPFTILPGCWKGAKIRYLLPVENDEKKEIVRKTEEIIKTLEAEGKDGQFR